MTSYLSHFVSERCTLNPRHQIEVKVLHRAFSEWLRAKLSSDVGLKDFKETMRHWGPQNIPGFHYDNKSKNGHMFWGLALRPGGPVALAPLPETSVPSPPPSPTLRVAPATPPESPKLRLRPAEPVMPLNPYSPATPRSDPNCWEYDPELDFGQRLVDLPPRSEIPFVRIRERRTYPPSVQCLALRTRHPRLISMPLRQSLLQHRIPIDYLYLEQVFRYNERLLIQLNTRTADADDDLVAQWFDTFEPDCPPGYEFSENFVLRLRVKAEVKAKPEKSHITEVLELTISQQEHFHLRALKDLSKIDFPTPLWFDRHPEEKREEHREHLEALYKSTRTKLFSLLELTGNESENLHKNGVLSGERAAQETLVDREVRLLDMWFKSLFPPVFIYPESNKPSPVFVRPFYPFKNMKPMVEYNPLIHDPVSQLRIKQIKDTHDHNMAELLLFERVEKDFGLFCGLKAVQATKAQVEMWFQAWPKEPSPNATIDIPASAFDIPPLTFPGPRKPTIPPITFPPPPKPVLAPLAPTRLVMKRTS